jgi:hypothetical protein
MNGGVICPLCRRLLGPNFWNADQFQTCPNCSAQIVATVFPAITTPSGNNAGIRCEPGESSCFFHTENRAEAVCDGCGRFLCQLCSISFGPRKVCPDCVYRNRRDKSDQLLVDQAVLYDNIAVLTLALSLLTFSYFVLGLVISLLVLCLVFVGWRYQRPLVPRSRFRFGIALILALAGAGGWISALIFILYNLPRYA